jgi:hypothetical protein
MTRGLGGVLTLPSRGLAPPIFYRFISAHWVAYYKFLILLWVAYYKLCYWLKKH